MRWPHKSLLVSAGVAALLAIGITPASAEKFSAACATTGANGSLVIDGWDPGDKDIPYVSMAVADSSADRHHVRIRLVISDVVGDKTYFQWHANYDGKGTVKGWVTEAHSPGNIYGVGIDVARFEGDRLLNSCTDRVDG